MERKIKKRFRHYALIRICHVCGHLHEGEKEPMRCEKCDKGFLPLGYFEKIHFHPKTKFGNIFSDSSELDELDLIKGLYSLW